MLDSDAPSTLLSTFDSEAPSDVPSDVPSAVPTEGVDPIRRSEGKPGRKFFFTLP
jgi:hypothetical protein